MKLRILTPSKNRPGIQDGIEELHGCHVEMGGVAIWKKVQSSRIGRAVINRAWAHGQPDRRRGELGTVRFRVREVRESRSAKARRLDRIPNSVFSGGDANADRENTGRTSRSPILVGPGSRGHGWEHLDHW